MTLATVIASGAKQSMHPGVLARVDCFVANAPRNDRRNATGVIPGRAQREPGISHHNSRSRIGPRPADRPE